MLSLQTEQQKTIRSLNPLIMLGIFASFLLIRTSCANLLPQVVLGWDFVLPFMIYFGQRRPLFEGLLLWFLMSHWFSLESMAPLGVWVIFYLLLFVVARLLSEVIYAADFFQIIILVAVLVLASRLVLPWIAHFFNAGWEVFSWRNLNPFFFITDTTLSCLGFLVLSGIDRLTAKESRTVMELNGGLI